MSAKRRNPAPDPPPEPGAKPLKISAVAEQAGVSKQTVEYYILLGLIQPESDPVSRRRQFDQTHVRRVKLIKQLNKGGYTLREIRELWLKRR
jgi:DNA-binding transcriptional MerR regulator